MKKILLLIVLLLCFGCAGKAPLVEMPIEHPQELIKYRVLIEGLEAPYHQSVIDCLARLNTYVRHTTMISKDGVFEAAFRFIKDPKVTSEMTAALNGLFMSLSMTVETSLYSDTYRIKVID